MLDNNLGGQFEAHLASTEHAPEMATQCRASLEKYRDVVSPIREGGSQLTAA